MNNVHRYIGYVIGMDTNDIFVRLGFCPEVVRITQLDQGEVVTWCRMLGNDAGIHVDSGTDTVNSDKGIKLVQFDEGKIADDATSDPSAVTQDEWYKANGIQITSDVAMLEDDHLYLLEAWGMDMPVIQITHDGGDATNTYVEDSSVDLRHAGVSSGWVVYNQTNGNYAYVGEVKRPAGESKYCRATLVTSRGGNATTAADIDDDDVIYLFPEGYLTYPKSDIGAMS